MYKKTYECAWKYSDTESYLLYFAEWHNWIEDPGKRLLEYSSSSAVGKLQGAVRRTPSRRATYRIMGILLNCSIVSGDSTFGPHGSRSKCFQVEPVTCWHLSVFLYEFEIYSLDSLQRSWIIIESWTSTGYFLGSTGSSVTSGRFFPVIGCVSHHYTEHLI